MSGVTFRIFPADGRWGWQTLNAAGSVISQGVAESRAVAAALVLRETISLTLNAGMTFQQAA